MDMDLRIGAVFSLADNSNERNHSNVVGKQEPVDELIMHTADDVMHSDTDNAASPLSHWHAKYYKNHSIDFDAPPPLSLETDPMPKDTMSVPTAPPVLEPVSPILEYGNTTSSKRTEKDLHTSRRKSTEKDLHTSRRKNTEKDLHTSRRKCMKIDPCYIVLTKVDKYVLPKASVSYRAFKRTYKECLNICKKVYFRRHLESGRDVFNVKTPSKQWHLEYSYTRKQQKQVSPRRNPGFNINVKRLVRNPSLKKEKNSDKLQRIRRTVSRVPKDFTERLHSKNDQSHRRTFTGELTENTSESELEQIRKRELQRLKKQIMLKRVISKRQKPLRKAMKNSTPSYFKPGTSNVSGRLRKTASKYLNGDFALTSDDINYVRVTELEKRRLKKEQRLSREGQLKHLRKEETEKHESKFDVVIDNPEKDHVQKISLLKVDANNKNDRKGLKVKVPFPERGKSSKRKSLEISDGKQIRPPKLKKTVNSTDGVLIQDMPDENYVIKGILQTPNVKENCENLLGQVGGNQVNTPSVKLVVKSNPLFNTQEMQDDKFKKFKIPSSVQRLFKVKSEPVDPDEVAQQDSESDRPSGSEDKSRHVIKSSKPVTVSPSKSSPVETFSKLFTLIPITGQSPSTSVPAYSSGTSVPINHQSSDALKNKGTIIISNTDKRTLNFSGNSKQQKVPVAISLQQSTGKNTTSLSAKPQVLTLTPSTPTIYLPDSPRMPSTPSHLTSLLSPVRFVSPAQGPPMSIVKQTSVTKSPNLTVTQPEVVPNYLVKNSNTTEGNTKFILVNMDGKTIVVPVTATTLPANTLTSSSPTAVMSQPASDKKTVGAATSPQNTFPVRPPVSSSSQMKIPQFVLSSHNRDPTIKANLIMAYGTPRNAYLNDNHSGPATKSNPMKSQISTSITSTELRKMNPVPVMSGTFSYSLNNGSKKISDVKVVMNKTDNASNTSVGISMLNQQATDNDLTKSVSNNISLMKQNKDTDSVKDKRLDPTSEAEATIKEKPKPFAEAVSAREERLRKLKELLKQQTKAVEELRKNKGKD